MNAIGSKEQTGAPSYWMRGLPSQLAKGLCGIIAVMVAIKAAAYDPSQTSFFAHQDHFVRILAFAALTVWTAFTIGLSRRGAAAVITLGFAVIVELLIVQVRHEGLSTVASANLGIVMAYCGLQLYWLGVVKNKPSA